MSVYKFVELVGTSSTSWEDAALSVVAEAGRSLDELRIAEVVKKDLVVARGKTRFRIRVNLSFKYLREEEEALVGEQAQERVTAPEKKAGVKKAEPRKAKKKAGKKPPVKK